ncbi:MAG: hypothetical protein LBP93_00205 [Treponema sp.]|nr:hypothetical protein [Treponema sp.]
MPGMPAVPFPGVSAYWGRRRRSILYRST